jgi:hypothetical protein
MRLAILLSAFVAQLLVSTITVAAPNPAPTQARTPSPTQTPSNDAARCEHPRECNELFAQMNSIKSRVASDLKKCMNNNQLCSKLQYNRGTYICMKGCGEYLPGVYRGEDNNLLAELLRYKVECDTKSPEFDKTLKCYHEVFKRRYQSNTLDFNNKNFFVKGAFPPKFNTPRYEEFTIEFECHTRASYDQAIRDSNGKFEFVGFSYDHDKKLLESFYQCMDNSAFFNVYNELYRKARYEYDCSYCPNMPPHDTFHPDVLCKIPTKCPLTNIVAK